MTHKRVRNACRALLLTPEEQVLLMKVADPTGGFEGWITPGGGIDPGENHEQTLRRELEEELGLLDFTMGPALWTREHDFVWENAPLFQRETFYLVRVSHFEPDASAQPDPIEERAFQGFRWWALEEIERSEEVFAPRDLAALALQLARQGPPSAPFRVNV